MGVETALVISAVAAAATGAAGAAASYSQAQQQNRAARKAADSTRKAAAENVAQVRQAESIEQKRQRMNANRIRAALRVSAAEQGAGVDDGSFADLDRQTRIDEQFNRNVTSLNASNQVRSVLSGADARLEELESRTTNALLDAFLGGVQGAGTGLSIGSSVNELRRGA